ncbi:MAG: 4-(cytidine 5'-diphospho)-2-C-methyl-D-erythritol kinase [Bacillota bacterium]
MKELSLTTQAKINLILDVVGQQANGYHQVEMIMQSIDLADRLHFSKQQQGIEIKVNHPEVPTGENNLVYQAAELLFERFNLPAGLAVRIDKEIPVAAGLAGGSTNAAATLVAINQLWELGLDVAELRAIGAQLGADVPFCITGGTVLATGIGTDLEELDVNPQLDLVLVKPPFSVATAEVYQKLNVDQITDHPDIELMQQALKQKKFAGITAQMGNVLAEVTMKIYPQLQKLAKLLSTAGAKSVLMSGSGPTMLGFVANQQAGQELIAKLRDSLPTDYIIKGAQTTSNGVMID